MRRQDIYKDIPRDKLINLCIIRQNKIRHQEKKLKEALDKVTNIYYLYTNGATTINYLLLELQKVIKEGLYGENKL